MATFAAPPTASTDQHPGLDPRLGIHAAAFARSQHRMLIDGEFVPATSGKTFKVFNPANDDVICEVPEADHLDVDKAVHAARRAFDSGPWHTMSPSARGKLLWKLADLLEKHTDEFAELEALDNGKPVSVARVADIPLAVDLFRYMAGWATKTLGSTIPLSAGPDVLSYTVREPIGVVAQIIPWNFPLLMAAWKLGPALATGCTVVMKLAEQTPLSGLRLAELFVEAGFPPGVVNILTGFGEPCGAPLAAHDLVDKVAFTGSTEVGKLIAKAATGNLKKVTLELGGKSPAIIFPDADMDSAIAGAASAIFFNQGQACCAGSRLFAHESVFDQVIEGMGRIGNKMKIGPGLDPSTEMGPLVSQEQFDKVTGYIASGQQQGAKVPFGGKRHTGSDGDRMARGYFVQPTVISDVRPGMKVVDEEIFGPVVVAQRFSTDADLQKLAAQANDTAFGLAASVWTSNLSAAHKMARLIKAGTVWVNCHNVFDAALPFGGFKQSGWGREMGAEVLNNYTEVKAVTIKL
jgi:phenylacetaldehyde dehydrogenase